MRLLKTNISRIATAATALFLGAMSNAFAQAPAAAAPHQHHLRYIAAGVAAVVVIVLIVMRVRNSKKQTA